MQFCMPSSQQLIQGLVRPFMRRFLCRPVQLVHTIIAHLPAHLPIHLQLDLTAGGRRFDYDRNALHLGTEGSFGLSTKAHRVIDSLAIGVVRS